MGASADSGDRAAETVDRFVEGLERVAEVGREVERAETELADHEARLLRRLLDEVRPVMPYVDQPVRMGEPLWTDEVELSPDASYYREPGVVLVNAFEQAMGPEGPPEQVGFSGYRLLFTRSGKLIRIVRRGVQGTGGQGTYWSSEAEEIELTAELARRHMGEILQGLVAALEQGVERAKERRSEVRERLARLKRVRKVLEEG